MIPLGKQEEILRDLRRQVQKRCQEIAGRLFIEDGVAWIMILDKSLFPASRDVKERFWASPSGVRVRHQKSNVCSQSRSNDLLNTLCSDRYKTDYSRQGFKTPSLARQVVIRPKVPERRARSPERFHFPSGDIMSK